MIYSILNIWEMTAVFFGILSVIGASLFVICFNIQVYRRNKRVEKKARMEFLKTSALVKNEIKQQQRDSLEVVVDDGKKKKRVKDKDIDKIIDKEGEYEKDNKAKKRNKEISNVRKKR